MSLFIYSPEYALRLAHSLSPKDIAESDK